jgi:hypothetical protein
MTEQIFTISPGGSIRFYKLIDLHLSEHRDGLLYAVIDTYSYNKTSSPKYIFL